MHAEEVCMLKEKVAELQRESEYGDEGPAEVSWLP